MPLNRSLIQKVSDALRSVSIMAQVLAFFTGLAGLICVYTHEEKGAMEDADSYMYRVHWCNYISCAVGSCARAQLDRHRHASDVLQLVRTDLDADVHAASVPVRIYVRPLAALGCC